MGLVLECPACGGEDEVEETSSTGATKSIRLCTACDAGFRVRDIAAREKSAKALERIAALLEKVVTHDKAGHCWVAIGSCGSPSGVLAVSVLEEP